MQMSTTHRSFDQPTAFAALGTKLLVTEQLLHPCPSSQQILATPLLTVTCLSICPSHS